MKERKEKEKEYYNNLLSFMILYCFDCQNIFKFDLLSLVKH